MSHNVGRDAIRHHLITRDRYYLSKRYRLGISFNRCEGKHQLFARSDNLAIDSDFVVECS